MLNTRNKEKNTGEVVRGKVGVEGSRHEHLRNNTGGGGQRCPEYEPGTQLIPLCDILLSPFARVYAILITRGPSIGLG